MGKYNNENMLKVLLNSDIQTIKAIIEEFRLQLNQSFINVLVNEFNYFANISTQNKTEKIAINCKMDKLRLIDSML